MQVERIFKGNTYTLSPKQKILGDPNIWDFPKIRGYLILGSSNKDPTI